MLRIFFRITFSFHIFHEFHFALHIVIGKADEPYSHDGRRIMQDSN